MVIRRNTTTAAPIAQLGTALAQRVPDVVARLRQMTAGADTQFEAAIEETFVRAAEVSTAAVARWVSGDPPEVARSVGWAATQSFGQLAAHRAAALHEVTKRCLRWRDATVEILAEEIRRLETPPAAAERALQMIQRSFDVTLVRMCEAFEAERQRIHEALLEREAELAFQSTHDPLTGLPNRLLILDRATQALSRARRDRSPVAALFIDLDNFKSVNDTYGHAAGDALLRAVVARVGGIVRASDTFGRLSGDELVVIAEGVSLLAGPELLAERILTTLRLPFVLEPVGDRPVTVTASIGIAADGRRSAEELLRDADVAMYQAKWAGGDRCVLFDSEMGLAAQSRLTLEMDLREAVRLNQFFLEFQPIFDLDDLVITGVEALVRWRHPTRGVVQPDEFVPLLEETGLITAVGQLVLDEACDQGMQWMRDGHALTVSINISARQLDDGSFVDSVTEVLARSGFPAERLIVEITETGIMRDPVGSAHQLEALRRLGVRVAIDDFGTGYSSLEYLRRFPVDTLKIDRAFVTRMLQDSAGQALIQTLVDLGKALQIQTLAEGIESSAQLRHLRTLECNSGQGFFLAGPLSGAEIQRIIDDLPQPVRDPSEPMADDHANHANAGRPTVSEGAAGA